MLDKRFIFESAAAKVGLDLTRLTGSGGYNSKITNRTWRGFKAGWAAAFEMMAQFSEAQSGKEGE